MLVKGVPNLSWRSKEKLKLLYTNCSEKRSLVNTHFFIVRCWVFHPLSRLFNVT